jgi:hypothetical protein
MKISKSEKRDCKKQKRIAEIEVEKLALNLDRDFLEFKVEEYMKELNEPLCDKCIFRLFELQKQILLNEQLKGNIESDDRKPEKKLFGKLVVDKNLQCSFCFSKVFISEKHFKSMENCELLLEKSFALKEAKEKKLQFRKTLKTIFFTVVILVLCYFIGDKQ